MVLLAILFLNLTYLNNTADPHCDLLTQRTILSAIKTPIKIAPFVHQKIQIGRKGSQPSILDEIAKPAKQQSSWIWWISFIGHPFTQWMLITILAVTAIWRHQIRRRETRRRWEQEEKTETSALEETRRQYTIH